MRYKNNPANIRFSESNKWLGQLAPSNGFCQFEDIAYGIRALCIVLRTYIRNYNFTSVPQIISTFAPDFENNTPAYISYVCKFMAGRDCNTTGISFGSKDFCVLCCAIMWYETHFACSRVRVENVINMFNLKSV